MAVGLGMPSARERQLPESPARVTYSGLFRHTWLDLASGRATIGGSGDYRVSWTTREDIARFLSYVLTHLTTSELSGRAFRIEGDNLVSSFHHRTVELQMEPSFQTYNEIITAYEKKTGNKVEVTRIPKEVLAEKVAA